MADDLLSTAASGDYDASSIEVLEGLEPVRKRPGMYIGGTDDRALHHLVAEVRDNSMDEAVAGHATRIEVELHEDYAITVRDNGRGIPIDPHPKFPDKSALEVILCTLHAGGKFSGKAYQTSGGLHGVGASVVNALSDSMVVQVARNKEIYEQRFSRGLPLGKVEKVGQATNRRGTTVTFHADAEIFVSLRFKPARLFKSIRSQASLFSGAEIRWKSEIEDGDTPMEATFHFPGGLSDFRGETLGGASTYAEAPFAGTVDFQERFKTPGKVEWAINWTPSRDGFIQSYCNTVPTPEGGTHVAGFWAAILKGIKAYGELANNRKAGQITREDLLTGGCALVSCFIREPEFVGQTKDRLATTEAQRLVENAVRDHFDNWLASDTKSASAILDFLVLRAEERLRRRQEKEGTRFSIDDLRYDKVIIMTDADVDGAHIASLLMTFFFTQMPRMILEGHLYLACPPLYRLTQGPKRVYCLDEVERDQWLEKGLGGKGRIDVSRFKGLGEMDAKDLKETTMDPGTRKLIRVIVDEPDETEDLVQQLMGKKPELRFQYIQENAKFVEELDV